MALMRRHHRPRNRAATCCRRLSLLHAWRRNAALVIRAATPSCAEAAAMPLYRRRRSANERDSLRMALNRRVRARKRAPVRF